MKINKKGFTLIELIVSITLISVIMVFMFSLLSDVTFEKDNEYFASKNQEIRLEIINVVSKAARYNYEIDDIKNYENPLKMFRVNSADLSAVSDRVTTSTFNGNETTIVFGDKINNHTLKINKTENRVYFQTAAEEGGEPYKYAWTLKQGKIENTTCKTIKAGTVCLIECTIKIFTDNDNNHDIKTKNSSNAEITIDNNNSLDDIVFDFMVNLT